MKFTSGLINVAAMIALCAGSALAESKPKGSKRAHPQTVANFLAGKTRLWKNCSGGGVYYGPKWQAQAWCKKDDGAPAIGIGTWKVNNRGKLCLDLTWYWSEDGGVGQVDKPVGVKDCYEFIQAPDGALLQLWGGDKNNKQGWWRSETSDKYVKGFKNKSKVNRLRKKLGV